MILQGQEINEGEIFIMEPNDISDAEFLEDYYVVCIKTPSLPGDKYLVDEEGQ